MKSEILSELKSNYLAQSLYWECWKKSKRCSFSAEELYVLENYVQNDFKFPPGSELMFYNRNEWRERINQKLITIYSDYINWLLLRLHASLLVLAVFHHSEPFLLKPISVLNISERLKAQFLKYNCPVVLDILQARSVSDFKCSIDLKILKDTLTALQLKIQKLKKKGGKQKETVLK